MANLSGILSDLKKQRAAAQSDIARIDQALAALTGAGLSPGAGKKRARKRAPAVGKESKREGMSVAAGLAVSRRMKKYWAKRRK